MGIMISVDMIVKAKDEQEAIDKASSAMPKLRHEKGAKSLWVSGDQIEGKYAPNKPHADLMPDCNKIACCGSLLAINLQPVPENDAYKTGLLKWQQGKVNEMTDEESVSLEEYELYQIWDEEGNRILDNDDPRLKSNDYFRVPIGYWI